jgi:hypothetical protein
MAEIRECPCGGVAESDYYRHFRRMSDGALSRGVSISCTVCSMELMHCRDDHRGVSDEDLMADLIALWNARPTEDALRAEVERLTASLRECQQFLAELTGPARPGEQLLNWLARCLEVECRARAALQPKGDGG